MAKTLIEFDSLKRRQELSIGIPASFVSDTPHMREKTFRIGLIGRAAAIFQVNEIVIYYDMTEVDQKLDVKLIQTILSYMETPQYLRRRLFEISPELQFAGTLPPLRTFHHPLANKTENLTTGEYREGAVVSNSKEGSYVDIGVEQPALIQATTLRLNTRVTVKITVLKKPLKAVLADSSEITAYWGYEVPMSNVTLGQLLKERQFDLVIATSRKGKPVNPIFDIFREKWKKACKTLVVFGAPTQGLYEIAAREHIKLDEVADFVINTIPNQGTETVRTEEAVFATLSILNTFTE
jgi:predicted SPOUT superfamily RNA methylase MTH1